MIKRTPTKQKLLNILKKDQEPTIDDIMQYFTISETAVRRHINELERQGFVKRKTIKQNLGRPYHVFTLTKKGHDTFPNQYETLPVELLHDLEDLQGKQAVNALLKQRMKREKKEFSKRIQSTDFDEKVAEVARIQDEKGYMVEVEPMSDGGYEIKHFNCPIANIAAEYRQVCSNEKKVFANIFSSSDVQHHNCITQGDHYCKWTISKPKKARDRT
ncbi:MAG TPA: DeoR family transcriptional regulator [Bacillota bacterium]|nr:DeoR family transcriptional regulator [Bacillota bacterium]